MIDSCIFCGDLLKDIKYCLKTTYSLHSNTLLVKNIVKSITDLDCNICEQCFILLNELDALIVRQKEIYNIFQNYVTERNKRNTQLKENNTGGSDLTDENFVVQSDLTLFNSNEEFVKHLDPSFVTNVTNILEDERILITVKTTEKSSFCEIDKLIEDTPDCIKTDKDKLTDDISESNKTESIPKGNSVVKKRGRKKKEKPLDVVTPHKCHCLKEFRTLGELKNHMEAHNDHKPFICEICGQAYKHKSAFSIHIGMHNGINPFTCTYCNKPFTQKGALMRHLPLHTGEMPYQCDQCGKRFVHHTSFNVHKLSHTGQKSYKCQNCGLALMSGSHLKRHMRVHTGEKRFPCKICGKRFAERYNLAVHEKLHNNPESVMRQNKKFSLNQQ